MAVRLAQGAKEFVNYLVEDTTGVVTTLVGTSPEFDITLEDGTPKVTDQGCTIGSTGMLLQCLVDTTSGGAWAKGLYYVYLHWTIGSETPREGPFELYVV